MHIIYKIIKKDFYLGMRERKGRYLMKNMLLLTDYNEMIRVAPHMKKEVDGYHEPFLFFIDGIVTIIGEIQFTKIDVYVKMVTSLEKRNGHGRQFINYLKELPDKEEIWGESILSAIPFWREMGAVFDKVTYRRYEESMLNGTELEEDFLLPFVIYNQKQVPSL